MHANGNPHYLLDPADGSIVAGTIAAAFTALDDEGASVFNASLAAFRAELAARLAEWERTMAPVAAAAS